MAAGAADVVPICDTDVSFILDSSGNILSAGVGLKSEPGTYCRSLRPTSSAKAQAPPPIKAVMSAATRKRESKRQTRDDQVRFSHKA